MIIYDMGLYITDAYMILWETQTIAMTVNGKTNMAFVPSTKDQHHKERGMALVTNSK